MLILGGRLRAQRHEPFARTRSVVWGTSQALGRTAANGDPLAKKVLDPAGTSSLKGVVAAQVGDDGTVYS